MEIIRNNSIGDYHKHANLPKPLHSLVSVIKFEDLKWDKNTAPKNIINNFYSIALKRTNAKMKYGQQEYDFDDGVLAFVAPNQIISVEVQENEELKHTGWLLIFHPDFLWSTALAKKIKQYDFFDYHLNEALHLSEKEEKTLINIIKNILQEYQSSIDKFSQDVIIAQLELLLTYSERYYQRQFITRKISNHGILSRLEDLLTNYFKNDDAAAHGLPTVLYVSERLNISPNYLSRLLKTLTGQSTQQFIHDKIITLAKEKLSTTSLSVNEVAYELGFEHPQSFNKLFKTKTNFSPLEFRQSFN